MPRRNKLESVEAAIQFNRDNPGVMADAINRETRAALADAANPTDDFDPEKNLRRVIALNAKVARLKARHEIAKNAVKETVQYDDAKVLGDELKGATAELDELLSELGREYPLFEKNGHA